MISTKSKLIMKCNYKLRRFSSKEAFLVLIWTLLVFTSISFMFHQSESIIFSHLDDSFSPPKWLFLFLIFVGLLSSPLSGWLADTKFGNYKVFIVGVVLLFISTVMKCLFMILEELVWFSYQLVIRLIL